MRRHEEIHLRRIAAAAVAWLASSPGNGRNREEVDLAAASSEYQEWLREQAPKEEAGEGA